MSTSTIGQYFSNRVEELISEFTGHTLIFFKGFGLEQIRFLITHPNSLLDDASLLHEGFLDLEAIDDRWLDLAASIKSATKPLVGFYEELLAIRQFLPRMKVDKLVVIENNILSPWVPGYFRCSYAEKLFDVNSHSIDDLDAELNGKDKSAIIEILKKVFSDNHADEHFNSHWK